MNVVSVNTGSERVVIWRGKEVNTGIFKYSTDQPIFLGKTDVAADAVVDRKHHGGIDKAVYAYSVDHYAFWKARYSDLDWNYGMFGENLTIEGLDESLIRIGSRYKVGTAEVEVSQPRQPCFKLGLRFGSQTVLKEFIDQPYPGVYFRVINVGAVKRGDRLELIQEEKEAPSIADVFRVYYHGSQDQTLIERIVACQCLPQNLRERIAENAQFNH